MPLLPRHVGQRVVVRRLLPGQQGPSGGPAMTDVLGILESMSGTAMTIRRDDGQLVTIERRDFVTGKPIPPRASTRLRISAEQLERICARGWRSTDEQHLGDWTLRAAGGFTGRANSVRVGGDPGLPLDAATDVIHDFYGSRGLTPLVQVVVGSRWQTAFEELGWVKARHGDQDAIVQVTSVAQARRAAQTSTQHSVQVGSTLTGDWLTLYGRTAGADPDVVTAVMTSGEEVAFAGIGEPVAAIGRAVVTGDWMGLQAVEVTAEHRREGMATSIVDTLLEWGASRGALSAYLQTLDDNDAARALYGRYGFTTHHAYRYLRPPDSPGH